MDKNLKKSRLFIKKHASKLAVIALSSPLYTVTSHAQTSEAITQSLNKVAGDVTSVLGSVAPIGLGIGGTFLAWKLGMRFFKALAK